MRTLLHRLLVHSSAHEVAVRVEIEAEVCDLLTEIVSLRYLQGGQAHAIIQVLDKRVHFVCILEVLNHLCSFLFRHLVDLLHKDHQ